MQVPMAEGFVPRTASKKIQVSAAAAEAVIVVDNAVEARLEAENAEPALKPNQPNQSIPVPNST
ncbi:hypothetical protein D3C87_1563880 [compost metagenome]